MGYADVIESKHADVEIGSLDATPPTVYVDMAGSSALRRSVHDHFGSQRTHSCSIGATHWEERSGGDESLPGPKPGFFFAPGQGQKRAAGGQLLRSERSRELIADALYELLREGDVEPSAQKVAARVLVNELEDKR